MAEDEIRKLTEEEAATKINELLLSADVEQSNTEEASESSAHARQKSLYLNIIGMTSGQLLLSSTTIVAAYFFMEAMLTTQFNTSAPWYFLLLAGVAASFFIDGTLDGALSGIEADPSKTRHWVSAIIFSLVTGGFSAAVGYLAEHWVSAPTPPAQREAFIAKSLAAHDKYTAKINTAIARDSAELVRVTEQWKKDTAAMLSSANESHANIYRQGLHKSRRFQSRRYQMLQAFCQGVDDRNAQALAAIAPIQERLEAQRTALSGAVITDAAGKAQGMLDKEDQRRAELGAISKVGIWLLDVAAIVALWFCFTNKLSLIKDGAKVNVRSVSFYVLVSDWLASLANAVVNSSTRVTYAFHGLLDSLLRIGAWLVESTFAIINGITAVKVSNLGLAIAGLAKGINRVTKQAAKQIDKGAELISESKVHALEGEVHSGADPLPYFRTPAYSDGGSPRAHGHAGARARGRTGARSGTGPGAGAHTRGRGGASTRARKSTTFEDRKCKGCGEVFTPKGKRNKYCSRECSSKHNSSKS